MPASATAMAAARTEPPNSASPPTTCPTIIMSEAALAAAGCGKAELGDREKELATVAEFALLIGPGLSLFLAHPALLGYVVLEQRDERAAVGIGDQLGR